MTYDFHPLVVHFPVALLCIYSLLQILPLHRWFPKIAWTQIKTLLLCIGFLGSLAGAVTGEVAAGLNNPQHDLLELHETFASLVQLFYGILLGSVIVEYIHRRYSNLNRYTVIRLLYMIAAFVDTRIITVLLSVLGLVALVVTGVFGGVMVYGAAADPIAIPLLQLFGVSP